MYLEVLGQTTFVATGGKPFDPTLPSVVLLHGSGLDHRCWALQARWFAFHGYSVFAPDFPGHSLSKGNALESIEAMGAWLVAALDSAQVSDVHLVGHSQGFLSALEALPLLGERVRSLSAIATAAAIPVNPALIDTAETNPSQAAEMMLLWGFGQGYQYGISAVPGMQPIGIGQRIMAKNPLAIDLKACSNYDKGNSRLDQVTCPAQVILAQEDRMTPIREGKRLAAQLNVSAEIINNAGHMLPMEAPQASLQALKQFIQNCSH